jgi:hypothetical protein
MYITIEINQEEAGLGEADFYQAAEAVHDAITWNPGINVISSTLTTTHRSWEVELTPAFFLTMMLWAKLPGHLAETMQWRTGDQGHRLSLRQDEGS